MKIIKNMGKPASEETTTPYRLTDDGVYHFNEWLCSPLNLVGTGMDGNGQYYRVIECKSRFSGSMRKIAIATSEIGSTALWYRLQGLGLVVASNRRKRDKLADYLQSGGEHHRWTISLTAGWTQDKTAYILPCGDLVGAKGAKTLFNGDLSRGMEYPTRGDLNAWKAQIGVFLNGNSRLCLAVGAALAAPLLRMLDIEGGGFHLFGDSSDGKTTTAKVALSVWGDPYRLITSWKGTVHGFDNIAAARDDGFVVLDEIGQADASTVSNTAYSIINGMSKVQGDKSGGNRPLLHWRVLVLSTGEKTLQGYLNANRGDWQAGQAARLPSIPADAGAGMGVFEQIGDFTTAAEFAEHLNSAAAIQYGTLGRSWVKSLLTDKYATQKARAAFTRFLGDLNATSGQGRRVAQRFALVYAALSLAADYNLLDLPQSACQAEIMKCFNAWQEREGTGKYEDRRIIKNALDWLEETPHTDRAVNIDSNAVHFPRDFACLTRIGGIGGLEVFITPKVFDAELCIGYDKMKVLNVLRDAGIAEKPTADKDKRWTFRIRFCQSSRRYYKLVICEEEDDKADSEL